MRAYFLIYNYHANLMLLALFCSRKEYNLLWIYDRDKVCTPRSRGCRFKLQANSTNSFLDWSTYSSWVTIGHWDSNKRFFLKNCQPEICTNKFTWIHAYIMLIPIHFRRKIPRTTKMRPASHLVVLVLLWMKFKKSMSYVPQENNIFRRNPVLVY